MRVTVLVSSRPTRALALAEAWSRAGDSVTVVLCDEAAAAGRRSHADAGQVTRAQGAGITVVAHDDALRRRGIHHELVADGLKAVSLDEIADLVAEGGQRAVWL